MQIASLEDDLDQSRYISEILVGGGYACRSFHDSRSFLQALRQESFDLVLVDWQLPDMDGDEVVRRLRAQHGYGLPVIFVTSRNQESDLVQGLAAGADDYVVKPVRPAELLARIGAQLRRNTGGTQSTAAFPVGLYVIDPGAGSISLHGEPVVLTPKEFELALVFFRNIGRLLSRDLLAEMVWNRAIPPTSRTLDTHLSNIRQKLQLQPRNGLRLTSSYALGYRLVRTDTGADDSSEPSL